MSMPAGDRDAAPAAALVFEDMGLRVGASLSMRPQAPGALPARYQVEFIGAIKGKSLLVSLPVVNDKGLWLPNGQTFVFHAVEGMYVYAFTSHVLRARTHPFPYVHFTWPTHIDARQVRKSYRVKLRLPLAVVHGAEKQAALLLDLSMTGALLAAPAQGWSEGDALSLLLPLALDEASSQLTLPATVRNRVEKSAGLAHYGVEFAALPQNDALLLHYYIDHAIARRIG